MTMTQMNDHAEWLTPSDLIEIPDTALPELQIISADIPTAMHKYQLQKAMREFMRRSRIQIRTVCFQLTCGVTEYQLELPDQEEFISFQRSNGPGRTDAGGITECGGFRLSWDVSTCNVSVHPEPNCAGTACVRIATTPSLESCQVDRKLFSRYSDALISGAKSYLYAMDGENVTWFNPSLAQYHELKFSSHITDAATDKMTGHGAGPFTMKSRRMV